MLLGELFVPGVECRLFDRIVKDDAERRDVLVVAIDVDVLVSMMMAVARTSV